MDFFNSAETTRQPFVKHQKELQVDQRLKHKIETKQKARST